MADNDLILRPKVDTASLRKSGKKMEKEYMNSGIRSAKKVAKFTQKALTKAMQQASKAGASALHSAFQVGLGTMVDQVKDLLGQIDDTVENTKTRADTIAATVNRAKAFNMDASELFTIEAAGRSEQLDETAIQGILEGFKDTLATSESENGLKYAKVQSESGTWAAIQQFMKESIKGQDPIIQQRRLAEAGFTGSAQTELVRLLSATGTGKTSIDELGQKTLGLSQDEITALIAKNGAVQASFVELENRKVVNDLQQASKAGANVESISELDKAQIRIANQQEEVLKDSIKFRMQMLELEEQVNKIVIQSMQHFETILNDFEANGFLSAIGTAIQPLIDIFREFKDDFKNDMSAAIQDALPPILRSSNTVKTAEEKAAVLSRDFISNGFRAL